MIDPPEPAPAKHPRRSIVPGIVLVLLGVFFLFTNYAGIELERVWPVFVIVPGLVFLVMAFVNRDNFGLIMPGTVLLSVGGVFLACEAYGWFMMASLWPVFILAPGVGFFLMFLFGKREQGFLIPAVILTAVGILFFLTESGYAHLWPLLLILIGVILLIRPRSAGDNPPQSR